MIKLSGSVGRMGPNKTGDVALIQAALMNVKGGPFWPGPIDGKKTTKFVEAITAFQTANRVTPANGTIQSFGPTMNKLKSALPMSMSGLGALPDSAVVFVAGAGTREAEREAEATKRKAPFPKLEAEALSKIQKTIGKSAGLCLERAKDSVTRDGCFATELDFQGVKWLDPRSAKPLAPGREPTGVTNFVWSQIGTGTPWQKGSPHDLLFKSKRQFKSLQNLGTGPLSADDKKLLGITTPLRDPVLLACAKGCAGLIRSGRAAKPAGKKEAQIIIEAASNTDPQLGKLLAQAASGQTTKPSPTSWPVTTPIVNSGFGPRPRLLPGASTFHDAVDFEATLGAAIFSTEDGEIFSIGFNSRAGNHIFISNHDGTMSSYSHTSPLAGLAVGQKVKAGQQIGTSDGTGNITKPHLHYTYRLGTLANPATPGSAKVNPLTTQFAGMSYTVATP